MADIFNDAKADAAADEAKVVSLFDKIKAAIVAHWPYVVGGVVIGFLIAQV